MLGGKKYGIHAAQKSSDVEEDILPMYILQVHNEKLVHDYKDFIDMRNEFSVGYETWNLAEIHNGKLGSVKCS